jgi:hypothetical protein
MVNERTRQVENVQRLIKLQKTIANPDVRNTQHAHVALTRHAHVALTRHTRLNVCRSRATILWTISGSW